MSTNSLCVDCGKDTFEDPRDYYMVNMEIWNEFGLGGSSWSNDKESWIEDNGPVGMLCLDDLERRMGRKVILDDLPNWPINQYLRDSLV